MKTARHNRSLTLRPFGVYAAGLLLAAGAAAQPARWTDDAADAVMRPTDGSGPVLPSSLVLPDLLSLTLRGWHPDPGSPYTGRAVGPGGLPPTLRLDLVVAGLVNPPGEVGISGSYTAFTFGPSPLYGFVELDVDQDLNTGGELPGSAELRYLANVGRFGTAPAGPAASRAARSAADHDRLYQTPPNYERSGADFSLVLCGCHAVEIIEFDGNDLIFSEGETWVLRSRFFQRAGGYAPVSAVLGGSDFGEYDPPVDLRFSHDPVSATTTVTLVYPLDEFGASLLSGEPVQPLDPLIDFGSHDSVVEALQDLVIAAGNSSAGAHPLTGIMLQGWEGRNPRDYLDPTQWNARAIVGTTYSLPSDGLYIWTDVGFGEVRGDVNGDGSADEVDNDVIRQVILSEDGGAQDADGTVNGQVVVPDFGYNFSMYDVNGDGVIDNDDFTPPSRPFCLADWDENDRVEVFDLLSYLDAWFASAGETNADGVTDVLDLLVYLDAFFSGC